MRRKCHRSFSQWLLVSFNDDDGDENNNDADDASRIPDFSIALYLSKKLHLFCERTGIANK